MKQTAFIVEEVFSSNDEAERKSAIQQKIEAYLKHKLASCR